MISPEDLEAMERAWQKVEFLGVNDLENEPTRKHLANAIVSMPDYMRNSSTRTLSFVRSSRSPGKYPNSRRSICTTRGTTEPRSGTIGP